MCRWWQWTALVRALDGYVTQVDRGRHSRFWNGLAGWVQAPAARPEARRAAAAAAAAGDEAEVKRFRRKAELKLLNEKQDALKRLSPYNWQNMSCNGLRPPRCAACCTSLTP